ncbi:MAG: hypothetical protein Q7V00_10805 [Sulfurimicrobium sp.]|nr:hypothetical protein [Sulfurimicrobium sp.]MDP2197951.1 hypothetical protein [Sulfurimicrobium sp.]
MDTQTFAALPPVPETVTIGGETLDITPLKVGELPAFARAVRPVASKLTPDPDWLRLLSEDGDSVILALAIACRRPPKWVAALALDEAIHLAEAVFEANADFFIRRVVPEITRVSQRIGVMIPGAMPSTDSSGQGTATPTS